MLRQFLLLSLLCVSLYADAQHDCQFDPDVHGQLHLSPEVLNAATRGGGGDTLYVHIKFHVVSSTFQHTLPPGAHILRKTNEFFAPHLIQLVQCGPYLEYIDNDIYYNSNGAFLLMDERSVPGTINVFVNGSTGNPNAGAFAFPPKDLIVNPYYNLTPGVLAHEVAHVLGLPHTFDQFDTELVNGSNCATAGDFFCDTPADPGATYLDVDSCIYTTGATDANGDTYMPDMENIMSYTRDSCRSRFSVEQGLRMYNVVDQLKWYLLRQQGRMLACEIVGGKRFCANDSTAHTLMVEPAGGVLVGPGIVGGDFVPALAGSGMHVIAYTPTGVQDSVDITNQYQTYVRNDGLDTLTTLWQSMRMENDGRLLYIRHYLKLEQQTDITISIYSGTGLGGTLLFTNTSTYPITSGFEWLDLPTDSMGVSVNDTFTYALTSNLPMIIEEATSFQGFYVDGVSHWGAFSSHLFAAMVRTPSPCGYAAYEYVFIDSVLLGAIEELNNSYCVVGDSIELFGTPTNGSFAVNNVGTSVFDPAALGIGNHTVSFTSTDVHGCVSTIEQLVAVIDFPVLFSAPLGPYCDTLPAQEHGGVPAGGVLLVDGVVQDSIYPGSLAVGPHSATYLLEQVNDTVYKLDQVKEHVVAHQVWPLPEAQQNTVYWQSFTVGESGVLDRVQMTDYNWNQQEFEVFLRKGEGVNGTLLFLDTLLFGPAAPYEFVDIVAPPFDIPMYEDSIYTAGFRWLSGPAWPPIYLAVDTGNTYPAGRSVFDDTLGVNYYDMYFKDIIRQYRYCRDSVTAVFDVEGCLSTDVSESTTGEIQVFPNPSNGEIQLVGTQRIDRVRLYNGVGELVYSAEPTSNHTHVRDLAAGCYLLVSKHGNRRQQKRVVVY